MAVNPQDYGAVPDPTAFGAVMVGNPGENSLRRHFKQRPAQSFADYIKAGFGHSVTGLVAGGGMPEVAVGEDTPWYGRAAASLSGIVGDIPVMIPGYMAGSAAGAAAGGAAGSAIPVLGNAAGAAAGGLIGGFAMANAAPAGIRQALIEMYRSGEATDGGTFLDKALRVAWETFKGGAVGASMGGAGVVAGKVVAPALGNAVLSGAVGPTAARVGTDVAVTAAEVTALATVGAGLEGRLPAARDFMDGWILIGGLKFSAAGAKKMMTVWEKTGKTPVEVLADAQRDPALKAELTDVSRETLPKAYEPLAAAENAREVIPGDKAQQVMDSPFAEIPQKPGEPTLSTHLNYNIKSQMIESPQDAMGAAARLSHVYEAEIQAQRTGTVSWEVQRAETQKLLASLADDPKAAWEFLARIPGTPAGYREIRARAELSVKAAEDMAIAAREFEALSGNHTPEQAAHYLASIERAAMTLSTFLGARSEPGRAMQALQDTKGDANRAQYIQKMLDTYGKDPVMLAKMLKDIDNPAGALRFAREATKATKWEMLIEAYRAGLIGPVSQLANIMGSITSIGQRHMVDGLLALTPKTEVRAVEPVAAVLGQGWGAWQGLKLAAEFLGDNWKNPMDALRKLDNISSGKMELESAGRKHAIPGDFGVLVRGLSFPWLGVADGAFKLIIQEGERFTWATRQAMNEGFRHGPREFREAVAQHYANIPPEVAAKIDAYVTRAVFQNPLGAWGKQLQQVIVGSKVGPLFIPFQVTPSNVFKEMARLSPMSPLVKAWRDDYKAGGLDKQRAIAEMVVGTTIMAAIVPLVMDERISGYGPPDKAKRDIWKAAGNQEYSVKIGDKWYSYQRIQPIGTLIGLSADMAEIWDYMDTNEQDKIPKMLSIAFSQAVTNQVWLKGLVDIAKGVAESDRYGPKIIQNLAGSMVPAAGWMGQTASILDPYMREVDSILEAIRNKIPLAREGLIAKRDAFGAKVENKERLGVVLPITVTTESEDKVRTEAARLGVSVGATPKKVHIGKGTGKIGDVKLSPEERETYAIVGGELAHKVLTQVVNDPSWDALPPMVKRNIYAKVFKKAHQVGAVAAIPPERRAELINQISAEMAEEMKPEEVAP